MPSFADRSENAKIPRGFPISRPAPMPNAGPTDASAAVLAAATAAAEAPAPAEEPRATAVLARAKSGMIKNVEIGDSLQ